jgi:outer membrane lipoprotein-sorting protein
MSTLLRSRRLRWAVPGAVAAAVAVASLTSNVAASASGRPKLPARTAAQLLVALQKAEPPLMSGTVVETAKLGLPDLPDLGPAASGSADLSLQTFVTGSHTLRVFYGGPDKQRVALLGSLSESDVVHNGTQLWTYSSTTHEVTESTLATPSEKPETAAPSSAAGLTPTAAAQKALAAIDPTTAVTIDRTAYVAGRSVYQVLLTPRDARSLVGSVRIALDAATSVPLRVQIFAKGATSPAIQVGFTDVAFRAPDKSIFNFVPPAGTTVKHEALPLIGGQDKAAPDKAKATQPGHGASDAKVIGSGWTAVVEMTFPQGDGPDSTASLIGRIATPVAGGRLITGALLSVLLTDDGHVYAGAVSGADLQKVAASGHAL